MKTYRYCGRLFSEDEILYIRHLIDSHPQANRADLSRLVCRSLPWLRPDGRLKDMSCRVAMIRMQEDELIRLPAPLRKNGNGHHRPAITQLSDPQPPICQAAGKLGPLAFYSVESTKDSALYNEYIHRYHYLGYKPLTGAQKRYMVYASNQLLALLGFGASAWQVADRDRFIGWSGEQRKRNLQLVINNARYLILPWVNCHNLASHILSIAAKRLPDDWHQQYGYRLVLLETFVHKDRFKGTCYRAANWIHVGQTTGRGKLGGRQPMLPIKHVFLYPLNRNFRRILADR
ncbi:hypothetical protein DSCO28_23520 [Desulfosarcina ovata subsp. sediminis]|uniref:Uncharacterized protein n=1 Tax=Desulfosarcina ovata subsp. sediminis TaxID=885957 RepID=A0A5K7ZL59_9BACT|nr:DUF4338 domain-containing protein [Desulfosarcina ovata]BBO81786.1 hypothetical protein DSCO28_23520 [Desulfosarcina ovata subsp. sediminis]